MVDDVKAAFLKQVTEQYGPLRKLERSQSLFEIGNGAARIYVRYSKLHGGKGTFYGLRDEDLRRLEGHPSLICFLWDGQTEPLLVPFSEYEDVFQSTSPAQDGRYKVQVYPQNDGTELYIARAGRFNVEAHFGWGDLRSLVDVANMQTAPELSHPQIQAFLGVIGSVKGYDIWIPPADRARTALPPADRLECRDVLPHGYGDAQSILQEVDVIWIQKGSSELRALFEIEHSTPIYSGLLRLNDVHLAVPGLRPRFCVVANDARRSLFVRQLNRPTFRMSGLSDLCTFLEYVNVLTWYNRIRVR